MALKNIFGQVKLLHLLLLGAAVRLVVLVLLPSQEFPDAKAYENLGRELFATGQMGDHAYMPLYPIWTFITGGGITLYLADIALSVATIWLIWALSRRLFDDASTAMLAALAAALWPHFAFYAVSGLTETAYAFVICFAFLCYYRERWFWGSLLLAISILIRPVLEPLIPILILTFALIVHKRSWTFGAGQIGLFLVLYVVFMSPWWVHQYAKYGTFVHLNLGDGIVLYSGNNPQNRSGGGNLDTTKGNDADLRPIYKKYAGNPIARNRALKAAAYRFIRENPGRFANLAGLKFVRFWRLWPYAPEYETWPIIVVSLLSYGLMLVACLWFLVGYAKLYWRPIAPILLLAAYLTAVHMVTIGSIRYRFPLEPFLIILGTYAISRLVWRRKSGGTAA